MAWRMCGNLAFTNTKANTRPLAKFVHKVKKGDHVLRLVSDEGSVIRVPLVGEL